ncbi:tetratricopeptide repeat protein [Prevotella rectalis]|uniref:tetratricopeptide repeat protein n=1 Tax=Prevotella rectalis TaxID=2219999 RepID=UPI00103222F4|nr:hypothetical protein [Prevotella brunnea]
MNVEKKLSEVEASLRNCNLGNALALVRSIYDAKPSLVGHDEFQDILHDFQLMGNFFLRGFADPQRKQFYQSLVKRLYKVAADLLLSWQCGNLPTFIEAHRTANRLNMSPDFLRTILEGFVSDVAMLSLEAGTVRQQKADELHTRHQQFLNRLFCALLVSPQWNKSDEDFYSDLLTTPTIDALDQQVMVAAVTLSSLNLFDMGKYRTLVHTCLHANDEGVGKRALVGWTLVANDLPFYADEKQKALEPIMAQPDLIAELTDLQLRLLNCREAERDGEKIQRDIMPNLIKNAPIDMKNFGLSESEADPLENIMNPNADEEKMEILEENIQRMMDMQKKGADIYFCGFRQLKHYPFFNDLSNWFTPFSEEHPALKTVKAKPHGEQLLRLVRERSNFCESDKYSLALSLSMMLDKASPDMMEAMLSSDAMGFNSDEQTTADGNHLLGGYLQDLYRFFKIKQASQHDIADPFADLPKGRWLIYDNLSFEGRDWEEQKLTMAQLLYMKKRYEDVEKLLSTFHSDKLTYNVLQAFVQVKLHKRKEDGGYLMKAREQVSDEGWALKCLADCYMELAMYERAAEAFGRLADLYPEAVSFAINSCFCLLKTQRYDDALRKLYELNYKHPDNNKVKRHLAWALLCTKSPDKAKRLYAELMADGPTPDDYLNAGYAEWIGGNPTDALELFRKWRNISREGDIMRQFSDDWFMLRRYDFSSTDLAMMRDLTNHPDPFDPRWQA